VYSGSNQDFKLNDCNFVESTLALAVFYTVLLKLERCKGGLKRSQCLLKVGRAFGHVQSHLLCARWDQHLQSDLKQRSTSWWKEFITVACAGTPGPT